ncbi:hypothetical protein B0T26DRAFT_743412 [Lasiosphaeria miniovina]|uniref:Zn(2)-C6 fungal-type domain-containing protein n=1 Tax=Lasiosphaeria miniovina TaxID=1954250 RepID=A0AA40A6Q9_9PEZI|nr:uncharacterized protein B0T26DRAFT_743412 [Lasiosphaeria miniovina]KAK0710333.1 hypothetical protein B0T26DRAFT_743412 [Lasiosphaeria miniovina]
MAGGQLVARKQNKQSTTKVKTGCATCRIRKIKCDEKKPFCQKCISTGRTCEGYKSPFRFFTSPLNNNGHAGAIKSNAAGALQPRQPTNLTEIALQDVELLNRYFSTKTMFDVNLGCSEEAKQVLQASLTHPAIRHAVLSLKALRGHVESSGDVAASVTQQTPGYEYGTEQYCIALRGLASNLSSLGSDGVKSALLCCQIFISIEQVRGNYAAMAQHIIQGLGIMQEYRARPNLIAADNLVPARKRPLPFLDVFIIKLFAAPCKFVDLPATADTNAAAALCPTASHQQHVEGSSLRPIAPNMRPGLTRIAASAIEFLDKVSSLESAGNALGLQSEKGALMDSLESWLTELELAQAEMASSELLSVSFMRLFHQILKIVILLALDSSSDLEAELRTENDRLRRIATAVGEGVGVYRTSIDRIRCG